MTLIKKLLTASLPVALVGVITPTIASCSCHKDSYTYEYGKHINCLDKSFGDYHKRKDVANAAKQKAFRQPRGTISIVNANKILAGEAGGPNAFNELIASITILKEKGIDLNNWEYTATDSSIKCDLKFEDITIEKTETLKFTYVKGSDSLIYLKINNDVQVRSYAFYDCIAQ